MGFGWLADGVMLLHAAFIAWAVFGGLAVWWRPRLAWLHLPALAWAVWISASAGVCPLTPLEQSLRARAGQATDAGGFIERHLGALIYPAGLTPRVQLVLAALLLGANAALYAVIVWRATRARRIA
jgi:hypothetical protein